MSIRPGRDGTAASVVAAAVVRVAPLMEVVELLLLLRGVDGELPVERS